MVAHRKLAAECELPRTNISPRTRVHVPIAPCSLQRRRKLQALRCFLSQYLQASDLLLVSDALIRPARHRLLVAPPRHLDRRGEDKPRQCRHRSERSQITHDAKQLLYAPPWTVYYTSRSRRGHISIIHNSSFECEEQCVPQHCCRWRLMKYELHQRQCTCCGAGTVS